MGSLADHVNTEVRSDDNPKRTKVLLRKHAKITASSAGLGWQGMHLEVGTIFGCEVDEQMVDGHLVGIQLNDELITVATQTAGRWYETIMPPHSIWIHPEGTPFSIRHSIYSRWAAAVIDGAFLDSVMGQHHELRASYCSNYVFEDKLLSNFLTTLISQISDGDPQIVRDTFLSNSLINGFVRALGRRYGVPATPNYGGIAPHRIKELRVWLEEHIGSELSVEAMAARVDLSVAHFAREFKQSTGMTPWSYVIKLRISLAHSLILQGESISSVARQCGFADQSHLSRVLRRSLNCRHAKWQTSFLTTSILIWVSEG